MAARVIQHDLHAVACACGRVHRAAAPAGAGMPGTVTLRDRRAGLVRVPDGPACDPGAPVRGADRGADRCRCSARTSVLGGAACSSRSVMHGFGLPRHGLALWHPGYGCSPWSRWALVRGPAHVACDNPSHRCASPVTWRAWTAAGDDAGLVGGWVTSGGSVYCSGPGLRRSGWEVLSWGSGPEVVAWLASGHLVIRGSAFGAR